MSGTRAHEAAIRTALRAHTDPLLPVHSESSTGNPLASANRQPEPASRPEKFTVPSSKASDVAQNPYFKRDFRRMYPKTEVVTQGELAKLLIAQGGFEACVPLLLPVVSSSGSVRLADSNPSHTASRPSPPRRATRRPPSRPTRPLRPSPRCTRPRPAPRPASARQSLLAASTSASRLSRSFSRPARARRADPVALVPSRPQLARLEGAGAVRPERVLPHGSLRHDRAGVGERCA